MASQTAARGEPATGQQKVPTVSTKETSNLPNSLSKDADMASQTAARGEPATGHLYSRTGDVLSPLHSSKVLQPFHKFAQEKKGMKRTRVANTCAKARAALTGKEAAAVEASRTSHLPEEARVSSIGDGS